MQRIKLTYGSARVSETISKKTIQAINELSVLIYTKNFNIMKTKLKAQDLRNGNLVKTNKFSCNEEEGTFLKVLAVGLDVDFTNGTTQNFIGIEGIPITEKNLKDLGFKWKNHGLRLNNLCIRQEGNSYVFYLSNESFNFKIKLEYVHQIQNLYFALTRQELEFNLFS